MLSIGRRDGSRKPNSRVAIRFGDDKMVGREAFVGRGISVPRVQHEQFVQAASSPNANARE